MWSRTRNTDSVIVTNDIIDASNVICSDYMATNDVCVASSLKSVVSNITSIPLTHQYAVDNNLNRMMVAIHTAYDKHQKVRIRVDDVWIAICQGWLIHLNENPDIISNFIDDGHSVDGIDIPALSEGVRKLINDTLYQCTTCNFMTSCKCTCTTGNVMVLAMFDNYIEYNITANCAFAGIEFIGIIDDWRKVLYRVKNLKSYAPLYWINPLIALIEKIIELYTSDKFDQKFIESMYKCDIDGNVSGWINLLFPYIINESSEYVSNKSAFAYAANISLSMDGVPIDRYPLYVASATLSTGVKVYSGILSAGYVDDGILGVSVGHFDDA